MQREGLEKNRLRNQKVRRKSQSSHLLVEVGGVKEVGEKREGA